VHPLTDESLRFAVLVGLASIPFTLALVESPGRGGDHDRRPRVGEPLLLAGVVVGYRYSERATESRRAGFWTGLVGSIATVIVFTANTITTLESMSSRMTVLAVALTSVFVAVGVGFTVVITTVAAMITDWVTTRVARAGSEPDPQEADRRTAGSLRLAIPAYSLLTPIVLLCVFWLLPDGGVGLLVSVLGLFVLAPLSVVAFVALFIEATAPQPEGTDRFPGLRVCVGVPVAGYALVYLATEFHALESAPRVGIYGFIVGLWIVSLVSPATDTGTANGIGRRRDALDRSPPSAVVGVSEPATVRVTFDDAAPTRDRC